MESQPEMQIGDALLVVGSEWLKALAKLCYAPIIVTEIAINGESEIADVIDEAFTVKV